MSDKFPVDTIKLAHAAASFALAYERLGSAIRELEEAAGVRFLDRVIADRQESSRDGSGDRNPLPVNNGD